MTDPQVRGAGALYLREVLQELDDAHSGCQPACATRGARHDGDLDDLFGQEGALAQHEQQVLLQRRRDVFARQVRQQQHVRLQARGFPRPELLLVAELRMYPATGLAFS